MRMKVKPYSSEEVFSQEVDLTDNVDQEEGEQVAESGDFSEYMWMENEEEFDKEVLKQLEEEALMEECMQAMLEDEKEENDRKAKSNAGVESQDSVCQSVGKLSIQDQSEIAEKSKLNPNAAEFVPKSNQSFSA